MPNFVRPLNLKKPVVNRKLIAWAFILSGLISVGSWVWGRARPTSVGREGEGGDNWWGAVKISYTVSAPTPTPPGQTVIAGLQSQLATASGSYSIYVYRLSDMAGYGIAAEKIMPAASITKVPIMVAAYRKVEGGDLKLADVQDLLQALGKRSDNPAVEALIKMIGREFVRQTVEDLGMINTDFDQNTTTAYDVAVMWRNLSEGKLINQGHWRQMQEFLTDSIFEDRIPAGVPDDVRVVHKVGTDVDVWADSGIVYGPKPFVIVILNKGVNLDGARATVPDVVRLVWVYETGG